MEESSTGQFLRGVLARSGEPAPRELQEIAPGLRRWTSWHDHWEEDVGSLAVDTDDGLVLIDPLEPPPSSESPSTCSYASTGTLARRGVTARGLGAARSRGRSGTAARGDGRRVRAELPGGIRASRPLGLGGRVLASGAAGGRRRRRPLVRARSRATDEPLRLCPERWLGRRRTATCASRCSRCSTCPVERVLVSHGAPVLKDGNRALTRLLAA